MHGARVTYAPQTYKDARRFLIDELDAHPNSSSYPDDLDPNEVGIVGDVAHATRGTSYHLGKDQLTATAYSRRLPRDRAGLTNGAAALDIGRFRKKLPNGRVLTLPHLSQWLVKQCQAGAKDAEWIREIGYSPDGKLVLHYDRERGQKSAPKSGVFDQSHTYHTHTSGYRDCEHVDKTAVFRRYLTEMGASPAVKPKPTPDTDAEWKKIIMALPLLKKGSRGADVKTLQGALLARGLKLPRWGIDGDFGNETLKAVKAAQAGGKIAQDGVVGRHTWSMLLARRDLF